ncbi:MAG: hypothetical protein ACXVRE_01170 [Gaiellaceae bacterium]
MIPIVGFTVGFTVGRWWAVLGAAPFGGWIIATSNLQGHVGAVIAGVLSALLALAIAAGVSLRRLRARRA